MSQSKTLFRKVDYSRSDIRKSTRYLMGRVLLSFGTLMFGGFFAAGMMLKPEEDNALPWLLFHTGFGLAIAFFGGANMTIYNPDRSEVDSSREIKDEERYLIHRMTGSVAAVSVIAYMSAILTFLLTDKYAASLYELIYGIYMTIVALRYGRNKTLTGRAAKKKQISRKRDNRPWTSISG